MSFTERIPSPSKPDSIASFDRTTTWLLGTAFVAASAVTYGSGEIAAYGFNLSQLLNSTALAFGPVSIAWASAVSVLAILAAYIGNNADLREFSDHQTGFGAVTAGLVVISAISSDWQALVSGGTSGLIYSGILFAGYLSMVKSVELYGRGDVDETGK